MTPADDPKIPNEPPAPIEVKVLPPAKGGPKAPSQGFEGGDVLHKDMNTATADWGSEYGPKSDFVASPKGNAPQGSFAGFRGR